MSLNNSEWSQINSIQMAVQSADLLVFNSGNSEKLSLSCTLLTIARGKCNVEIRQNQEKDDSFLGNIIIPRDRPIMQCDGLMQTDTFNALCERFTSIPSVGRPILLTIFLNEKLSVSVNGDLFIENTREIVINHIDFVFPLR